MPDCTEEMQEYAKLHGMAFDEVDERVRLETHGQTCGDHSVSTWVLNRWKENNTQKR